MANQIACFRGVIPRQRAVRGPNLYPCHPERLRDPLPDYNWSRRCHFPTRYPFCFPNNPVPLPTLQERDGDCIALATLTLLQLQCNFIGMIHHIEVPFLSEGHILELFESLPIKNVTQLLRLVSEVGIVAEADYDPVEGPTEGARRYFIDYHYSFRCEHNNLAEFIWRIKYYVLRYGGVLCEFEKTDEYDDDGLEVFLGGGVPEPQENGLDLGHVVTLLGWTRVHNFVFLDSQGQGFGIEIADMRGYGRIRALAIHQIYLPQIRQWW